MVRHAVAILGPRKRAGLALPGRPVEGSGVCEGMWRRLRCRVASGAGYRARSGRVGRRALTRAAALWAGIPAGGALIVGLTVPDALMADG